MRTATPIASGYSFLESPRWHGGRLYASDFFTLRVLAFDETGNAEEVCQVPGQPSGLGFAPDGALMVVSMLERKLMRFAGNELSSFADLSSVFAYPCNDMLLDENGRAYVGSFGWAPTPDGIIESSASLAIVDGTGDVRMVAAGLVFPNGMARLGATTLVVAETFASRVTAFEIAADGVLTDRRVWASFSDRPPTSINDALARREVLPDGIAADAEGALWVADAGGSGVVRVTEGGSVLDRIEAPGLTVFAVALGGADGRTAFLCASPALFTHDPAGGNASVLLACRVDVPAAAHTGR